MLIYEIKPSRYHLTHVLSPDPRPHCWIPLVLTRFRNLGQNPRYQMLSPNLALTQHSGKLAESPPPSQGSSQTAEIHCPTVQTPRASSSWTAGHCLNPHPTAVSGALGDCPPHCQTYSRSHSHLNRSRKRLGPSAAHPGPNHCCCCGDVWQKDKHWSVTRILANQELDK